MTASDRSFPNVADLVILDHLFSEESEHFRSCNTGARDVGIGVVEDGGNVDARNARIGDHPAHGGRANSLTGTQYRYSTMQDRPCLYTNLGSTGVRAA